MHVHLAQDYSNNSIVANEYVWSEECSECDSQVMNNNAQLSILTTCMIGIDLRVEGIVYTHIMF